MGWGRLLLLGDLGQQFDLIDAQKAIAEAQVDVARLQVGGDELVKRIRRIEAENDELKLYLAAVVHLLRQKSTITREELERIVAVVDHSDGSLDGRYSGKIVPE
jgi:hypothetical protein